MLIELLVGLAENGRWKRFAAIVLLLFALAALLLLIR